MTRAELDAMLAERENQSSQRRQSRISREPAATAVVVMADDGIPTWEEVARTHGRFLYTRGLSPDRQ